MCKFYKLSFIVFTFFLTAPLFAQNRFFTDAGQNVSLTTNGVRQIFPNTYRGATANALQLKNFLWSLPSESSVMYNHNTAPVMEFPMPDGKMARFHVWESSVMDPQLASRFAEIKSFAGQGIDDPYATVRFSYNPYFGFNAMILSAVSGRIFIDPYARYDVNNYLSYYAKDGRITQPFVCDVNESIARPEQVTAGPCRGTQLLTYRLAVACTGEYAVAVCSPNPPTVPVTMAEITNAVTRVTGVYESETAVRMVLIPNNSLIVYLDGNTDPYTNNSGGAMLGQNQANIDAVIGSANYDIGHVFSTGGGGVAGLGVVCVNGNKARGVTGLPNPVGDDFYIDYVAHEMGHQYAGSHTFNGSAGSCGGNRTASAAYEVGSGTTIQGYAGICGSDNTQPNSDPFFHTYSFDQIGNFVTSGNGGTCPVGTPTGNILPVITAMNDNGANIPLNTPFTLTGAATDANGDAITYCWEEWDLGPAGAWNSGANSTTAPLFKSRVPKTSGSRTFPDIAVILAGYPANPPSVMGGLKGETLPLVARAIKFRLTVRDNRAGGGGVVTGGDGCAAGFTGFFQVNTIAGTGPFLVTAPNGGQSWAGGSTQTITWDPAGTTGAPISTANVKISLSTDGGLTYPTVIIASTANDGTEALTIPSVITTTARVKIEAVGNIFFDISDNNFTITAAPSGFTFNSTTPASSPCPAGTTMQVTLGTTSNGGFNTPINLSATSFPSGTSVSFNPNPVIPGNSTIVTLTGTNLLSFGSHTVGVQGVAGAVTQNTTLTYNITAGTPPTINTHPNSQAICQGNPVTFTVSATGALSYQWQKSTDGIIWNPIGGATSTSFTIANVQLTDAAQYRCQVSGQCGLANSNVAVLTVNTVPQVTGQPADAIQCAASNVTFTSTATGTGINYQWQLSLNGCAGPWNPIGGATASSYTINNINAGQNNTGYRVVVTGTCTPAAPSNCALLSVITSVNVTQQPGNQTVCEGSPASFTTAGSGSGVLYQWQVSTDGGVNYNNISGATSATYTIPATTFAMDNNRYRALLTNATCTTPGISNPALLRVNTLPAISASPQNATICVGGNNTFSVTASGTNITYQWYLSIDGGANYNPIGGATTSSYTVTSATIGMNTYRYRVIVNGTCTPPATSTAGVLTVIAPVTISAQPAASEICSGTNTSFSVTGSSVQTINYQWQESINGGPWNNVNNVGIYSGATTATLTITGATTALNPNRRYRVLLSNATCTAPTISGEVLLTVRPLPIIGLTASLTELLPGKTSVLTAAPVTTPPNPFVISWYYNTVLFTNASLTYNANVEKIGTYRLTIAETWPSSLVCSNQSADVVITAKVSDKLFIFPSPNDGRFTVSYYNNGGASTQRKIVIMSSAGQKVYERMFPIVGPYTLLNIDMRNASRGIYYVLVGDVNGAKLATGKVHVR